MKAAIYARVSTARQEKEETIESQISSVKERIHNEGNQLDESSIFTDEGYSGSIIERPALDKLKEHASRNEFELVYVYDYGRLSRDLTNLMLLKDSIEKDGIKVISLHEHITGEDMSDRLMIQMMGAFHEYERKKIAQRFHNGKMQKAKRGELVGYNAPYGYRYNKEAGDFDIYEPEAAIVKKMFEWIAYEGISTYAVLQRLHELNVKPPKGKSKYWTRSPVARILSNETYYGRHFYNKTEAILPRYRLSETKYRKQQKTGRRIRPRDEWIEIKVKPIISESLFIKAREQIARNIKFKPTNRKYDYLLTSLIKCTCGANRNADGPNGKKYYRCISRHRHFDRRNRCKVGGINVQVVDAVVWKQIARLLSDPDLLRKQAERWLKSQKIDKDTDSGTKRLKTRLNELKAEQKRYIDAYGKGLMPESNFAEKMDETNNEMRVVEGDISKTSKNRGGAVKMSVDELVGKATFKLGELEYKQKKFIVERVIDKIISSPKEITIWGHIPVPALAEVPSRKVNFELINRHSGPA